MSDNKTKTGSSDRAKINQHEPYEMETAAKEMDATRAEIRKAIAKVGVGREKVAEYVERKDGAKK